jgi:transcriptional regulator with XRE-family HTH domain
MTNPKLAGLQCRREFQDLTQADLAELIGVTASQFSKFEKGLVRLDVYRAAKLARRLGCTIDELL